jgi:hypothetical protein
MNYIGVKFLNKDENGNLVPRGIEYTFKIELDKRISYIIGNTIIMSNQYLGKGLLLTSIMNEGQAARKYPIDGLVELKVEEYDSYERIKNL